MPQFFGLHFIETILTLVAAVLQIMLLFSSIRAYRITGTRPLYFLMWACVCYAVPHVAFFASDLIGGFLSSGRVPSHHTYTLPWWRFPLVKLAEVLFLALAILALRSFLRGPTVLQAAASNQALQPSDGRSDV